MEDGVAVYAGTQANLERGWGSSAVSRAYTYERFCDGHLPYGFCCGEVSEGE